MFSQVWEHLSGWFNILPVIPPDLRPMLLDGGRFFVHLTWTIFTVVLSTVTTVGLLLRVECTRYYRSKWEAYAQEGVDALIDNGRRGRPITGPGSRPLNHWATCSKVNRRFRQNLLGKRVDFSDVRYRRYPTLKMYQWCATWNGHRALKPFVAWNHAWYRAKR